MLPWLRIKGLGFRLDVISRHSSGIMWPKALFECLRPLPYFPYLEGLWDLVSILLAPRGHMMTRINPIPNLLGLGR